MNESHTPKPGLRHVVPLRDDWLFTPERAQKAWLKGATPSNSRPVSVPHSWNAQDTFQKGLRYRQGDGFYICRFKGSALPCVEGDPLWQLRSGGFYGTGEVRLNGQRLARVDGQYLGFTLDVSSYINLDADNTLTVSLNNRYHPYVLPGKKMPDFLLHGGLAGEVELHVLPRVHVDDQTLGVLCRDIVGNKADLELRADIHNQSGSDIACRVRITILATDEQVVHTEEFDAPRIAPGATTALIQPFTLADPQIWSVSCPTLYTLRVELVTDNGIIDSVRKRFGVRTAVFDGDKGFLLNGEPLYLHGANRHECMPGFGNALPPSLHRRDAEEMKALGLNLVRLAHYPQHPSFLDACDEMGLLVYAEIASWKSVRPGPWARAAYRQLSAMIRRDRHHPSIILWGLANESRSRIAFKQMTRIRNELDPTRETIYAENHLHRGQRWRTIKSVDVLGVNYELDRLPDARAASRKGAVLISEMSNCARTRRGELDAEWNQVCTYHRDLARAEAGGHAAGYTLWCYNDYPTQRKHRIIRRPGLVDAWRLPKMACAYIQARTCAEPLIRVYGDWHRDGPETARPIRVITNCDRVILRSQGNTLLEREGDMLHELELPFHAAPLEAVGLKEEREVASDVLRPCGRAARLILEPEQHDASAKDQATVAIRIKAVDDDGEPDSRWMESVTIAGEGPSRMRTYTEGRHVEMGGGLGRVFVTSVGQPGRTILRAAHEQLQEGTATIAWI